MRTKPTVLAAAGTAILLLTGSAPATAAATAAAAGATVSGAAAAATAPAARTSTPAPTRVISLPDGFRPEGIASRGRTFYTGSLGDGRIWAGDLRTGEGRVLLPGQAGRSLRGMQVDPRTRLLWVAGNEGATGIVLAVDTRTGEVVRRVVVPDAAFLNDLVVTRRAVWVTDSRVDRLTRVPLARGGLPTGGDLRFLPLRGDWATPEGIRANGIRQLPDGRLVVVNSAAATLYAVSPWTGVAEAMPVSGGPGLTGGDGLVLRGKRLYVVRGSGQNDISVLRLHRTREGWTATWRGELTDPALSVPSTATLARGRLWAVNARFGVVPDPAAASYTVVGLDPRPRD